MCAQQNMKICNIVGTYKLVYPERYLHVCLAGHENFLHCWNGVSRKISTCVSGRTQKVMGLVEFVDWCIQWSTLDVCRAEHEKVMGLVEFVDWCIQMEYTRCMSSRT